MLVKMFAHILKLFLHTHYSTQKKYLCIEISIKYINTD